MSAKHAKRFDVLPLGKAERTDQGFIRCSVNATRTGVFVYRRPDGGMRRELRLPAEVFDADSMKTLKGVPVTNRHPSELVSSKNAKNYTVGYTSDTVEQDGKFLKTSATIIDAEMIAELEKRDLREVSCGYTCDLDFSPGVYDGEEYDCIQRNIRYNHLAVVDRGRAGAQVRLHLDADSAILDEGEKNDPALGGTMAKMKLGGAEYEVDAGLAMAIDAAMKEEKKKGFDECSSGMKPKMDSVEAEVATAKKESETLKAKNDELVAKVAELEKSKLDSKQIHELSVARASLIEKTKPILGDETKFDEMDALAIKKAVIAKKYPELKVDEKSTDYVEARFDAIMESESKDKTGKLATAVAKADAARGGNENETAEQVRARNMKADSENWQKPIGVQRPGQSEE